MADQDTHVFFAPVADGREEDFERLVRDVVEPAVTAQRPDLVRRWQCLRTPKRASADGEVVTYAFVFDGGDLQEDWDLEELLRSHYGQEEAALLLEAWVGMLVPLGRWVGALGHTEEELAQPGWTFTAVNVDNSADNARHRRLIRK